VGLEEVEGISGFPSIRELYLAFNCVSSLSALMCHETLEILDLEGNQVKDFSELTYLTFSDRLFSLTLAGNPLESEPNYRDTVISTLS
jgi:Leucine-rich repeat (LRR) protein